MIRLLEGFDGSGLGDTHYSRVIRSHLSAYGTGYDFCLFYEICSHSRIGIISVFNGAVTADLTEGSRAGGGIRREIREFVEFQRPYSVELPTELAPKTAFGGYSAVERKFYKVLPASDCKGLLVPEFEDAFRALELPNESFPLWLTDTAKRVNSGLSELIGLYSSVLTVRFMDSGLAYISDLATPSCDRGKGHARELLQKAAKRLYDGGMTAYLSAQPSLWGFYEKAGCQLVGEDIIYIAK